MAKAPAAAASAKPAKSAAPAVELRYEDRPDLLETFADSAQSLAFDGRTLRIEFTVNRPDPIAPKAGKKAGRSVPVVRLVLDLDGAIDLFNKVNALQAAMESRGVIKTNRKG